MTSGVSDLPSLGLLLPLAGWAVTGATVLYCVRRLLFSFSGLPCGKVSFFAANCP